MLITFVKQPSEITHLRRREFHKSKIAMEFIKLLYHTHQLDAIMEQSPHFRPIFEAGRLPKNFNIHHIHPLSGGGKNTIDNLCLIEVSLHNSLNKYFFDPALRDVTEPGQVKQISVPDLTPVSLYTDFLPDIQKKMREIKAQETKKAEEEKKKSEKQSFIRRVARRRRRIKKRRNFYRDGR